MWQIPVHQPNVMLATYLKYGIVLMIEDEEGGDNKLHQYPKNGSACQMDDPCFTDLTQIYGCLSLTWQAIFRISNMAMDIVFKFVSILLHKLSEFAESTKLKLLAEAFPNTMLKAHTLHAINRDNYQQLIVCEKCNSTYEYSDCLNNATNATCSFIRFPRHPQARMRTPCGTLLLKNVKTSSHKTICKPIKVFCYRSLIESIQEYVRQDGYLDLFNQWKTRARIPPGVMADIYDGAVWQSFQSVDGKEFLSGRYSLGLLLNVDWFNPYKHVEYSVGAMYVAILNFPRHLRYQKENMILAGIIPGPREPSLHMNSVFGTTCKRFAEVMERCGNDNPDGEKTIRAALLCTASDRSGYKEAWRICRSWILEGMLEVSETFSNC